MISSLLDVEKNPQEYSFSLTFNNESFLLRPLTPGDAKGLGDLISHLSEQTKKFYSYTSSPETIAREHIDAIGKYDKLRFVLENKESKQLIGLFEFSMDIPENDKERFEGYGISMSESDCRFGPLLRDDYQSKGIASLVFPFIVTIAQKFDKKRIILWGGVHQDNLQAIKFYEKNGFIKVGSFLNQDNILCDDMVRRFI